PWVAVSRGVVGRVWDRGGGGRCWGVIDAPDRGDIVFSVPPLPVAILLRVDQPALFESFQGGGADPHLLGCLGNAHTSSPDASLPRPFRAIRDHPRSRAVRRRAPAAPRRHRQAPSSRAAPGLGQAAALARGPVLGRGKPPAAVLPARPQADAVATSQ